MKIFRPLLLLITIVISTSTFSQNQTHWWNDNVFYEIFVRSFYDSNGDGRGDFQGLIQKLDYLNDGDPNTDTDLGITGIWFMPVNPSPSYHGYDVTDYRGINPHFGTMNDFKQFVQLAQARGIKIIIDLVMNHSSRQHPWFQQSASSTSSPYRDWYIWRATNPGYPGSWGQQVWHSYNSAFYFGMFWSGMPDLNMANQAAKQEMFDITAYWLDSIGVDGFRLDAIKHLFEDGQVMEHVPATFTFLQEYNTFYKGVNPEALTVGEVWSSTPQVVPYVTNNRLDLCFEFDLASAIITGVKNGTPTTVKSRMDIVNSSYPFLQYATFLTNHDQDRVFGQLSNSIEKMKLAASIYLTLPGVPFIYYGEEVGMVGFGADENKRRPMQWNAGTNAGFTTGTPWYPLFSDYSQNNVAVMQANPNSLWNRYASFIKIRNSETSLRQGAYRSGTSSSASVYNYIRSLNDEAVFVIHNFSAQPLSGYTISVQGSRLGWASYNAVNLLSGESLGTISANWEGGISNYSPGVTIEPYGTLLIKIGGTPSDLLENGELPDAFSLSQNFPNPVNSEISSTSVSFSIDKRQHINLTLYDLLGTEIAQLSNEIKEPGEYSVNITTSGLSNGIYFYTLRGEKGSITKKMIVVK
ncbi:MAG: T9SS type A sorting domain-containing protein [Ignavibacteriaceae bacterium]|nr:T9SS type A sorting domain-containing protein [Ignavibacteriaceae bacterium]